MSDDIRKRIKEAREALSITQIELGMKAFGFEKGGENRAQKIISKIELGKRDVGALELWQLSRCLKVSMEYLTTGGGEIRDMGENRGLEELKDRLLDTQEKLIKAQEKINELERELAEARGTVSPENGVATKL